MSQRIIGHVQSSFKRSMVAACFTKFYCRRFVTSPFATLQLLPIFLLYFTAIPVAWTDGLVPGGLRQGGAGIHIKCAKCVTATSLSFSTGLWATSYSAETFAILHALKWCISHSKTCNFQSFTLFSDSLSVLSTLSAPLPYLTPKSLSNTQSLLNSLSNFKVVHLQWMPGHSSFPGNDLPDSLAKVRASLDPSKISVSLSSLISSQRLSLYTSWRRSVQSGLFQLFSISEELALPRSVCCALSRLRCNGHSTLLNTYLHRVGRAETPSCSNCGSESQDLSHLGLDCPVLDHLRRPIFGHSLSLLNFWSRPWRVARLLGLRGVDPHSRKSRNGLGKRTTTTTIVF